MPTRRFNIAAVSGVLAGISSTLIEIPLWQIAGDPWLERLFRDARLTAAIIIGPSVLTDKSTSNVEAMLIAAVVHFTLAMVYAIVFFGLIRRKKAAATLAAGALFGMALYLVNMYCFTYVFPWFVLARNWITGAAHLVFGLSLGLLQICSKRRLDPQEASSD